MLRAVRTRKLLRGSHARPHIDLSTAFVVFACTNEEIAELNIEDGPCVRRFGPRGGRRRPLASPHSQFYPDTFEQFRILYALLTGDAASRSLHSEQSAGPGTLALLSNAFVEALAKIRNPDQWNEVAARWLDVGQWQPSMKTGGLATRLVVWAGEAEGARAKGLPVYCWRGPAVPVYAIASGIGRDSYEAYTRSKKGH